MEYAISYNYLICIGVDRGVLTTSHRAPSKQLDLCMTTINYWLVQVSKLKRLQVTKVQTGAVKYRPKRLCIGMWLGNRLASGPKYRCCNSSSSSFDSAGQRLTPHGRTLEVRPGRINKTLELHYDYDVKGMKLNYYSVCW